MKAQPSKITTKFCLKTFSFSFLFYLFVFIASYVLKPYEIDAFQIILMIWSVVSSCFFPLSYKLAERFMEKPIDSEHWIRGLGLFIILLAIPFGLIELVIRAVEFIRK